MRLQLKASCVFSCVIAADAIEVGQEGVVILAGLDAPDAKSSVEATARFGQSALSELKALLSGAEVRLVFDSEIQPASDGSRAAYINTRDGLFINGEMLKKGLALAKLDGAVALWQVLPVALAESPLLRKPLCMGSRLVWICCSLRSD